MTETDFLLELKTTFLDELDEILLQLEDAFLRFEKDPDAEGIMAEIFRYFHNVKGSSKTVGLTNLSQFAHRAESMLSLLRTRELKVTPAIVECLLSSSDLMKEAALQIRQGDESCQSLLAQGDRILALSKGEVSSDFRTTPVSSSSKAQDGEGSSFGFFDESATAVLSAPESDSNTKSEISEVILSNIPEKEKATTSEAGKIVTDESIKISLKKIDSILDLFGEQVILQSSLDHALNEGALDLEYLRKTCGILRKVTQDLQHTMVTLRMVPLKTLFSRLERAVRDVATLTGKQIDFVKVGQDNELDKNIVDALVDPLTHMVRNAVDHGVESIEERARKGKEPTGRIVLSAIRSGGSFEIVLQDDGKGLNRAALIAKANKLGLLRGDGNGMSDEEVYGLIFKSGFSTVDKATEISGRGVGMDVVRRQVEKLKGTVSIASEIDRGTCFTIRLPLSLAMFNGTIISVNQQRYVIPNSDFNEALNIETSALHQLNTKDQVMRVRDRVLKVIDLRRTLTTSEPQTKKENAKCLAIVAHRSANQYALLVDDILTQDQIVLKQLGPEIKQVSEASGGTILSDGRVALVLDINQLINKAEATAGRRWSA